MGTACCCTESLNFNGHFRNAFIRTCRISLGWARWTKIDTVPRRPLQTSHSSHAMSELLLKTTLLSWSASTMYCQPATNWRWLGSTERTAKLRPSMWQTVAICSTTDINAVPPCTTTTGQTIWSKGRDITDTFDQKDPFKLEFTCLFSAKLVLSTDTLHTSCTVEPHYLIKLQNKITLSFYFVIKLHCNVI